VRAWRRRPDVDELAHLTSQGVATLEDLLQEAEDTRRMLKERLDGLREILDQVLDELRQRREHGGER
jgi:hypothetical protein